MERSSGQTLLSSQTEPTDDFLRQARITLKALRRETAQVLATCQGVDRAIDVAARLDLDRSLAWKVWQVGRGTKSLPSPAHVPGKAGYQRFLDAAKAAGVPPAVVEAAREAYGHFVELTRVHAGDRATVSSMLGSLSEEGRERMETAVRRDGFRANAYFLGVQAALLYQLDILLAWNPGQPQSIARVRGHFGLRRNRANVPWVVAKSTLVTHDGPSPAIERRALDKDAPSSASGEPVSLIVPRFSSNPLPALTRRTIGGVTVEDELMPGPLGHAGAVDIVTGEFFTWMRADEQAREDAVTMTAATPSERLCYEVIAPESLIRGMPTLRVMSTVQREHPFLHPTAYAIPVTESFEDLGDPRLVAPVPEVPRYSEMISWALSQAEVSKDPLRLWRLWMKFPPVPSCVAASYAFELKSA